MTLDQLLSRLQEVNDYLVEAENALDPSGSMPEFDHLHSLLDIMSDVVIDLINDDN